jgi:hypothetical protein
MFACLLPFTCNALASQSEFVISDITGAYEMIKEQVSIQINIENAEGFKGYSNWRKVYTEEQFRFHFDTKWIYVI